VRRFGLSLLALLVSLVGAPPASAAIGFDANNVNIDTGPAGIASDFFQRGGNADLVTANQGAGSTSLLLGNGAGGFSNASGSPFAGPTGARDAATGDFNRDNNEDVVAAGVDGFAVRLGNGSGGLGLPIAISVPMRTFSSAVTGDFNSDNSLDFAASTSLGAPGAQQIFVFLGNGATTPTFSAAPGGPITIGQGNTHLAVGDFNNDGKPDLAVTSSTDHNVQVLLGTGTAGAFNAQTPVDLGAGTSPQFPAIGDLNNDGKADLAVTNANGGATGALVLIGDGTGGFTAARPTVNVGSAPEGIAIDDIDFDDFGDLVVANNTSPGGVTVALNAGNGMTFTSNGTTPSTGNGTFDVATDDFNNDGNIDIAATNSTSNSLTTFIQQPPGISVNPTTLNFGNVTVDTTSGTQTVTLTNNGSVTIGPVASITGSQRGDFRLVNDRCSPASVFVGPGGTCTIGVNARSGSLGGKTATLEISSNAANSPQRVTLNANIVPRVPVSEGAPVISGFPVVGAPLSCSNGTWTNSPTSFAHQWLRNGVPIPGETTASYTVGEVDVGQQIACSVTASNAGGSSQPRRSAPVVPTAPTPVLTVTVPKQTLNTVISKGLAFNASCQRACLISAQVTGPVPPKKRKSRRGRAARTAVVGRTTSSLVAGTTQKLRVKINRAGRKALATKSKARMRLSVTATDPSGSPSTTGTKSVLLKKKARRKSRS
jgi:hypothetical protein